MNNSLAQHSDWSIPFHWSLWLVSSEPMETWVYCVAPTAVQWCLVWSFVPRVISQCPHCLRIERPLHSGWTGLTPSFFLTKLLQRLSLRLAQYIARRIKKNYFSAQSKTTVCTIKTPPCDVEYFNINLMLPGILECMTNLTQNILTQLPHLKFCDGTMLILVQKSLVRI